MSLDHNEKLSFEIRKLENAIQFAKWQKHYERIEELETKKENLKKQIRL